MSFNLVNILDIYYNQLLQSNVKIYIDIAIEKDFVRDDSRYKF